MSAQHERAAIEGFRAPKHIVLLSYEFTFSQFSGNGIYARSIVKSLLALECKVTVWCCRPEASEGDNHLEPTEISEDSHKRLLVVSTLLQRGWRRLDDQSGWIEFVFGNLDDAQQAILEASLRQSDIVCAVDWSGAAAYRSLSVLKEKLQIPPMLYLNFRVYSSGVSDPVRREWFDEMERTALLSAKTVVGLSAGDVDSLAALLKEGSGAGNGDKIRLLLPPLRQDMESLSHESPQNLLQRLPPAVSAIVSKNERQRPFLTCVVRQSPEKEAKRFVRFVEAAKEELTDLGYVVLLAGAAGDAVYAKEVKQGLVKAYPSAIVIRSFLPPSALGAIFARTALNFHPCSYDAYGMTIIEAAAFGAPSVIAKGEGVGAVALVGPSGCFQVEMPKDDEMPVESTEEVLSLLRSPPTLSEVAACAKERALEWGEAAYGEKLLGIIEQSVSR